MHTHLAYSLTTTQLPLAFRGEKKKIKKNHCTPIEWKKKNPLR